MIYFILALGIDGLSILSAILGYFFAITLGIVMHEFAHGFVAHKCGDDTAKLLGRLTLNPLKHFDLFGILCFIFIGFGWAKPIPVNPLKFKNYKRGQRLVSAAGVITNFVLAFIFSGLSYFFSGVLLESSNLFLNFLGFFLLFAFYVNISLALFNLLPIYPLDGFNFIKSFTKPGNKFIIFMERFGTLVLFLFILTSAFDFFYGYFLYGVEYVLFSFWGLF